MLGLRSVRIALPAIAGMFPVLVTTILSAPSAWASSVDISRSIDVSRELFITDVGVVDDDRTQNGGAWSFGGLMTRLAGDINPEEFVAAWAETLTNTPIVNEDPEMENSVIIDNKEAALRDFFASWRVRSQGPGFDLDTAPFRLLAIVNRPDLLSVSDGDVHSAGEARFVFAAVDPNAPDPTHAAAGSRNFFVIFEYGIPAESCSELKGWHQRWHELGRMPAGSPRYKAALELITNDFTLPDPAYPALNGSKLNQLRSNEFFLTNASLVWDLREWNLVQPADNPWQALLASVTTKQTPSLQYVSHPERNAELRQWLEANTEKILDGVHEVTERIRGADSPAFLGGIAINDLPSQNLQPPDVCPPKAGAQGTLWWAPRYANDLPAPPGSPCSDEDYIVSEKLAEVRHRFALQTCSGCHFAESGTDNIVVGPGTGDRQGFKMTSAREHGFETTLSPFLTGTGRFPDPVNSKVRSGDRILPRELEFNDLERRKNVLSRILAVDCNPAELGGPSPTAQLEEIAAEIGTRVH